jgi:DNA-directed RNA polymerase subunit M/transcription elongation factor TFIIS
MRFCEECGNMLVPKNGKLYCKACEKDFDLDKSKTDDYKIIKTIKHDEKESAPIVVKDGFRGERISGDDRKAYEDLFEISEGDSY